MTVSRVFLAVAGVASSRPFVPLPAGVDSFELLRSERRRDDAWLHNLVSRKDGNGLPFDNLPVHALHLLDVVRRVPVIDEFTSQYTKVMERYLIGADDELLHSGTLPSSDAVGRYERALRHLGTMVNFLLSEDIFPLWGDNFNAREAVKFTAIYHVAKRSPGAKLAPAPLCADR